MNVIHFWKIFLFHFFFLSLSFLSCEKSHKSHFYVRQKFILNSNFDLAMKESPLEPIVHAKRNGIWRMNWTTYEHIQWNNPSGNQRCTTNIWCLLFRYDRLVADCRLGEFQDGQRWEWALSFFFWILLHFNLTVKVWLSRILVCFIPGSGMKSIFVASLMHVFRQELNWKANSHWNSPR